MKKFALFIIVALLLPQIVFAKLSSDPQVQQWGYADVKAYGAWDNQTGSRDVVVAVIDNGFDTFHSDLKDNVWKNIKEIENNNIDDDNNGYIDDVWGWNFVSEDTNGDGFVSTLESKGNNDPRPKISTLSDIQKQEGVFNHGTVVAGIIGAVGDNAMNGVGINWKVRLMNVKVIDNSGSGDITLLGPAIRYAVNNGAHILNISMVGNFIENDVMEAIRYANDRGVAIFAAAGNDNRFLEEQPRYPVCADQSESKQLIIGVSAVDQTHHLAPFSNYGSRCVDIAAPGVGVLSTQRYDPATGLDTAYGGLWNGTSFAVPFVSGAAALVKAIQPTWQAPDIYNAILSTTHKTPPQDEAVYAHLFGKGLLQIDKAVVFALAGKTGTPSAPVQPVVPPPVVIVPQPEVPVLPSPVPSTKIVEPLSVLIFNDATAKGDLYNFGVQNGFGSPLETRDFISLQGLESISRYKRDDTHSLYGVLYFRGDGNSIVRLYNEKMQIIGGYKKKLAYASTLVMADVVNDSEPESVLAPKTADTLLFSVSDKNGKEIFQVSAPQKHSGVSITKKFNPQTKKDEIVVLYKQGVRVFLEKYNSIGEKIQSQELSAKTDLGGLFYGDGDGDGVGEYAMVVTIGDTVWVRYYDDNGMFVKRAPLFQLINTQKSGLGGKVNVTVDDFDNDGKFEMIINEKNGGKGVYGVFGKGERVTLLTTLKNAASSNYFVVPFVK